jgi:hypothetical protein
MYEEIGMLGSVYDRCGRWMMCLENPTRSAIKTILQETKTVSEIFCIFLVGVISPAFRQRKAEKLALGLSNRTCTTPT